MSLIVFGIVAAAALAGVGGGVVLHRRRVRALPAPKPSPDGTDDTAPAPPALGPVEVEALPLPVQMGDVLQVDDETRWPRGAVLLRHGPELRGALLLSREAAVEQCTVALAPPARHLLWLRRVELAVPASPPTRIEIDGLLLDRTVAFPAALEVHGDHTLTLGSSGRFALYEGTVGDAAALLVGADATYVWHGRRLGPGDWDNLGQVGQDEGMQL